MSGWKSAHYAMVFIPMYVYPLSLLYHKEPDEKVPIGLMGAFYIMVFVVAPVWIDSSAYMVKNIINPEKISEDNKTLLGVISDYSSENDNVSPFGKICMMDYF